MRSRRVASRHNALPTRAEPQERRVHERVPRVGTLLDHVLVQVENMVGSVRAEDLSLK